MKITVTIDDTLYQKAMEIADPGMETPEDILQEALRVYIRIQAAKHLAELGEAAPDIKDIPR